MIFSFAFFYLDQGTRFWCSEKSGGVNRDWKGYPRQLFDVTTQSIRCACVKNVADENPNLSYYPNCLAGSHECTKANA